MAAPSEWVRHGDCSHCGYCCFIVAESIARVQLRPVSDVGFYQAHGFHILYEHGQPVEATHLVAHMAVCPQWTGVSGEPGCRIYATRPRTCQAFPTRPDQIANPQCPCTYWFERTLPDGTVERRGGRGSPYPQE